MKRRTLAAAMCLSLAMSVSCASTKTGRPASARGTEAPSSIVAAGGGSTPDVPGSPGSTSKAKSANATKKTGAPVRASGAKNPGSGPGPILAPGGDVKIGVHYSANLDAAYAAFGAQKTSVDYVAVINAIADYINKHGGMGGRKLVVDIYGSDPLQGDFDVLAQQACDHFTQDAKVFAVVSGAVLPSMVTPDCLAQRKTPLAWEYQIPMDDETFGPYMPYLYQPFSVVGRRLGVYIDGLKQIGFFDPGAKIGLLRYDTDEHKRIADTVIKPKLAQNGLSLTDEQAVARPASASGAGGTAAGLSNAILSFKQKGVTHVIFVPTGGAMPFVMLTAAQSQGFKARYGFNSLDIPYFVAGQAPKGSLTGALGVGWMPSNDVDVGQFPPDDPAAECRKITNVNATDPARFCDGLFFFKTLFDRGVISSAADVQRVAEALGDAYRSHWTYTTHLGPGRHDGATSWRPEAFDDGCSCWKYTGPARSIA